MKTQFSVRLHPRDKAKIEIIASENSRTLNGQLDFLVKECIEHYEKVKGEIEIKEENQENEKLEIRKEKRARTAN